MEFTRDKFQYAVKAVFKVPVMVEVSATILISADNEEDALEMAGNLNYGTNRKDIAMADAKILHPVPRDFYAEAVNDLQHPEFDIDEHIVEHTIQMVDDEETEVPVIRKLHAGEYSAYQSKIEDKPEASRQKHLREFGFYIHYNDSDEKSPTGFNIHTHGLPQTRNHLDFQVVHKLSQDFYQSFFKYLSDAIKNGARFQDGDTPRLLDGYMVKIINAMEDGRSVLRIIFPDRAGQLEYNSMDEHWRKQYEMRGM